MKMPSTCYHLLAGFATLAAAHEKPPVSSDALRSLLTADALMSKAQIFENHAYLTPQRNRAVGSPGLEASLRYILDTVKALDYYDVTTQEFTVTGAGTSSLKIAGTQYESQVFSGSPEGNSSAPLVAVANLGCNSTDFPASASGAVALISRGTCAFAAKASNARAAGAVAAIIYNNNPSEGPAGGGMGNGSFVPTVGITQAAGKELVAELQKGTTLTAELAVTIERSKTYNIVAQTKGGDPNNVLQLGAHVDSVEVNPGLNDDASGSIGILEVALQLAKFSVENAIRFSWWSGEEAGLVGSTEYVKSLSQAERDKIRLYLNFDMIASINWFYAIYASNGTGFEGRTPPPGVLEAEGMFQHYFADVARLNYTSFDLRKASDHGPFIDAGIATGGLFTGGSEIKTAEQVAMFGGTAGVPSDPENHKPGDNVTNVHPVPFLEVTKAIGHAVAFYGQSVDSLPPKSAKGSRRA